MRSNLFIDKSFKYSRNDCDDGKIPMQLKNNFLKWRRPEDICCNPSLYAPENKSKPVQGGLDDCWLVSGSFILCHDSSLLKKIFQNSINFKDKLYCGKWTLSLHDSATNEWVDVTIDDQLPTINNSLIFGSCIDKNQFWFPLLEKACAKFYGSYDALSSGQISEAFMLITGGFCWRSKPVKFASDAKVKLMKKQIIDCLVKKESMLAVVSKTEDFQEFSGISTGELVESHYYVITDVSQSTNEVNLSSMWTGGKSNKSTSVALPFSVLCHPSLTVTFCATSLASVFDSNRQFHEKSLLSSWQAGVNSGGKYGSSLYECNPQYLITFGEFNQGLFYVNLIQTNHRGHQKRKDAEQALAIHIWKEDLQASAYENRFGVQIKVSSPIKKPLCRLSMKTNPPDYATNPVYQYKYDVSLLGSLPEDQRYLVVIPSTFSCNINCQFHLRFCASLPFSVEYLNKKSCW